MFQIKLFICIKMDSTLITYNGWYAIKPNQYFCLLVAGLRGDKGLLLMKAKIPEDPVSRRTKLTSDVVSVVHFLRFPWPQRLNGEREDITMKGPNTNNWVCVFVYFPLQSINSLTSSVVRWWPKERKLSSTSLPGARRTKICLI